MDRFRALQVFLAVADHTGFAPAAEALRMSPTAVTRIIAALEDQIGVRLFARTTRRVRLTDAGALFAVDVRRILADLVDAEGAACGATHALRGRIRLTAPVLFGRSHVAPAVLDFLRLYPQIGVDLVFVDRMVDLLEEDIDIAVRIAELEDSSLTAVRVGSVGRVLCASPDYLRRRGPLARLNDLATQAGIELSSASTRQWTFRHKGADRTVRPNVVLGATSPEVVLAAVLEGLGVARFMTYQVRHEIEAGRLEALLSDHEMPALPVHIVHHSQRHLPRRVRVLLDHLRASFRGQAF